MHGTDNQGGVKIVPAFTYLKLFFFPTAWSRSGSAALQIRAPPKAAFVAPWLWSI